MNDYGPEWVDRKARQYIAGAIGFNALPSHIVKTVKHRAQQIMGLEPTLKLETAFEPATKPEPKPKPKKSTAKKKEG